MRNFGKLDRRGGPLVSHAVNFNRFVSINISDERKNSIRASAIRNLEGHRARCLDPERTGAPRSHHQPELRRRAEMLECMQSCRGEAVDRKCEKEFRIL